MVLHQKMAYLRKLLINLIILIILSKLQKLEVPVHKFQ